jgi:hypothetical protein
MIKGLHLCRPFSFPEKEDTIASLKTSKTIRIKKIRIENCGRRAERMVVFVAGLILAVLAAAMLNMASIEDAREAENDRMLAQAIKNGTVHDFILYRTV